MARPRNLAGLVTHDAPVMAFDYPPDGEPTWPCSDCLPWHVDVVIEPDGTVLVREWHAVGCPIWDFEERG